MASAPSAEAATAPAHSTTHLGSFSSEYVVVQTPGPTVAEAVAYFDARAVAPVRGSQGSLRGRRDAQKRGCPKTVLS